MEWIFREILARKLRLWALSSEAKKITPDWFTEPLQRFCRDLSEKQKNNNNNRKKWEVDYLAFLKNPEWQVFPSKIVLNYTSWEKILFITWFFKTLKQLYTINKAVMSLNYRWLPDTYLRRALYASDSQKW